MSKPTYFDVVEQIEDARNDLRVADASKHIDDVIIICEALINLIEILNSKDAPE